MKRVYFVDNISAICLFHVIFVIHCARLSGIDDGMTKVLMTFMCFCMPWFYFKSGLFYKARSCREEFFKNAHHLLKPFVIYSFLGWIPIVLVKGLVIEKNSIDFLLEDTFVHFLSDGSIRGNYALWFLLSLFVVKQVFQVLKKVSVPTSFILFFSVLVALYRQYNDALPVYIGNVGNGLFFYTLGFLISRVKNMKVSYLFPFGMGIGLFLYPRYLDFRASVVWGGNNNLLYWLFAECFCVVTLAVIYILGKKYNKKIQILTAFGQKTMLFYVFHYIILVVSYNFLRMFLKIENPYGLFMINTMILIFSFSLLYILYKKSKWLRYSLGERI